MYSHITLLIFSQADGLYLDVEEKIDGAPMPLLIHSGPTKHKSGNAREQRIKLYHENEDTFIELDSRFLEGLSDKNPLQLTVQATQSGSMTKEIFLDAMIHFTKHLPDDQGKDGKVRNEVNSFIIFLIFCSLF